MTQAAAAGVAVVEERSLSSQRIDTVNGRRHDLEGEDLMSLPRQAPPSSRRVDELDPCPPGRPLRERDVIDALPGAVVVTDRDGRIVLWSAAAEQLYGWAEPEVLGCSVLDVLAPVADLAANQDDLAFVAAGNRKTGDRVVARRDGSTIRVSTVTRPLVDDDGAVVAIVGCSEEVGALRRAEQQSRDLSEHFRAAVEAGGLGTWRWSTADREMVWDERLEALFGLAPGGFDGRFETYVSLLHPDDRDAILATVREAMATRSVFRVESKVVWPDGSLHWIAGAGGVTLDENGEVTGTVGCAIDLTDRIVQEREQRRLAALAVGAAERERLHRERLEFLGAVNEGLLASSTLQDLMTHVTRTAVPRLGDWCTIHVLPFTNGAGPDVEVAHVDPTMVAYARDLRRRFPYDPEARFGVARVMRTGQTEFHPDITGALLDELGATEEVRQLITALDLRSTIAVALRKRGRILGVLQFAMSSVSRRYTSDDVALAHSVAARIASSIENLRLYERQRDISRTLQRSLLPSTLPTIPGVEVAVRYWPAGEANEVGGDFYDVFRLDPEDQWAVVIGDVCGTGPAAAALTGLARHSMRDSAWHGDNPVEVLRSLNRAVKNSATGSFITAIYATLDTAGSRPRLTVASGGHPLPIHVPARTTGAIEVGTPGTLLGMFDRARFETATRPLGVGDVVVFYTDGATDVHPPNNLDRSEFLDLVQGAVHRGGDAEAVADNIRDALETVVPFSRRNDDIALLVLRVTEAADAPPPA